MMTVFAAILGLGLSLGGAGRAAEPSTPAAFTRCGDGECGPGTRCVEGKRCPKNSACAEYPFWCLSDGPAGGGSTEGGYPPMGRDPWRGLAYRLSPDKRAELGQIFHRLSTDENERVAKILGSYGPGDGRRLEPYFKGVSSEQKLIVEDMLQNISPCGPTQCGGTPHFDAPLCYGDDNPDAPACERHISGECEWSPPRCRRGLENCRQADCGPTPMMGWRCGDGTTAGFRYCVHQVDGRCGWQVVGCAGDCGISLLGGEPAVYTFECGPDFSRVCRPDHLWHCERSACRPPSGGPTTRCAPGQEARWDAEGCIWQCALADRCDGRCRRGEECRVVAETPEAKIWGCADLREKPCPQDACGPRLNLPNWQCLDGSLGGPGACSRAPNGACRWKIHFCSEGCAGAPPKCERSGPQCVAGTWTCGSR